MLATIRKVTFALAATLLASAAPLAAQYSQGEEVIAQWGDNRWYPGKVERAVGNDFRIRFLDGDVANLPTTRIRPDTFEPGDPLFVRKGSQRVPATLAERYGNALVVTYRDGTREAVDLKWVVLDTVTTRPSRTERYFEPRVLANLCNRTSETVYYALAMDTYNGGSLGNASSGWRRLGAQRCEIYNLTYHWRNEVRLPPGYEDHVSSLMSPTYIYGQTLEAFQNRVLGGAISIESGLRWGGEEGENEYCIMDRPRVSFRHVVDHEIGLVTADYCQDDASFKVPFREVELPPGGNTKGGVINWTFGD